MFRKQNVQMLSFSYFVFYFREYAYLKRFEDYIMEMFLVNV